MSIYDSYISFKQKQSIYYQSHLSSVKGLFCTSLHYSHCTYWHLCLRCGRLMLEYSFYCVGFASNIYGRTLTMTGAVWLVCFSVERNQGCCFFDIVSLFIYVYVYVCSSCCRWQVVNILRCLCNRRQRSDSYTFQLHSME